MQFVSSPVRNPGTNPSLSPIHDIPPLDLEKGPWLAGGAARKIFLNEYIGRSDYDLFFRNQESFEAYRDKLVAGVKGTWIPGDWVSTFLINDHTIVQLVHGKFFDTIEALIESFDLSLVMFATDCKTVVHTDQAVEDGAANVLRIVTERPYKMPRFRRLAKYCGRGFTPLPGVMSEMLCLDKDFAKYYDDGSIQKEPTSYVEL